MADKRITNLQEKTTTLNDNDEIALNDVSTNFDKKTKMRNVLNYTGGFYKGLNGISLTNYENTLDPSIAGGSTIEINGSLYQAAASVSITGWASIYSGSPAYIYVTPSGSGFTAIYSNTKPVWDNSKQGFYTGLDRCVAVVRKETVNTYRSKRILRNQDSVVSYTDGMGLLRNRECSLSKVSNWMVTYSNASSTVASYGVTWSPELGLFCAVGYSTWTSTDGKVWTVSTPPTVHLWLDVTWSPELGLFCAVAADTGATINNTIMTSPDGVNWTNQTVPVGNNGNVKSITWSPELGLFCAVGANGTKIMTSPDGVNWTARSTTSTASFLDITWSPELGLFCAVGSSIIDDSIITSPDGTNWTIRTFSPVATSHSPVAISWSPELGLFCASCTNALALYNRTSILISTDGINWQQEVGGAISSMNVIVWSPELSLFCGTLADTEYADGQDIATSFNGVDWSVINIGIPTTGSPSGVNPYGITWSPELNIFAFANSTNIESIDFIISSY